MMKDGTCMWTHTHKHTSLVQGDPWSAIVWAIQLAEMMCYRSKTV